MKPCRKVRKLIETSYLTSLSPAEQEFVECHLRQCRDCLKEARHLSFIFSHQMQLKQDLGACEQDIDWEANIENLTRITAGKKPRGIRLFPVNPGNRLRIAIGSVTALAAAALLLIVHSPPRQPRSRPALLSEEASRHIERNLTKNQLLAYLNESQMVLSDLMSSCSQDTQSSWELSFQKRKVAELLKRKKLFQDQLEQLEFAKAKGLCDRIDLLCYEILSIEETDRCQGVTQVQDLLRRDQTLMKIRLVHGEFMPAMQEV